MAWFNDVFLRSFKEGETQISQKQFDIFAKNLKNYFEFGFTAGYTDIIDGFNLKAYSWECITGTRFYIVKSKIKK